MMNNTKTNDKSKITETMIKDEQSNSVLSARNKKIPQTLVTLAICIFSTAAGTILTWSGPALTELQHSNSTIAISQEEGSWIAASIAIGAVPGAFLAGYLSDRIGRRLAALLAALPLIASWLTIGLAEKAWLLYLARALGGMSLGSMAVTNPMYISEIADRDNRATLGAFHPVAVSLGTMLTVALSAFLTYRYLSIALGSIPVLFLIVCYFIPESPVYCVIKEDLDGARKSLRRLHGTARVAEMLEETVKLVELSGRVKHVTLRRMLEDKAFVRGLIISLGIMASIHLCGVNVMMAYSEKILMEAGSSIHPKLAVNIIIISSFVAGFLQLFIIEHIDRKILLLQNCIIACIAMAALSLQHLLQWKIGWLPLVILTLHSISLVWGFEALAPTITAEVIAPKAREYAFSAAVLVISVLNFTVTKTFPLLVSSIGSGWTFMIFSGCMVLASLHVIFIIPETRGKTIQEIQDELYRSKAPRLRSSESVSRRKMLSARKTEVL